MFPCEGVVGVEVDDGPWTMDRGRWLTVGDWRLEIRDWRLARILYSVFRMLYAGILRVHWCRIVPLFFGSFVPLFLNHWPWVLGSWFWALFHHKQRRPDS